MTIRALQDASADLEHQLARLKTTVDDFKRGVLDYDEVKQFATLILQNMQARLQDTMRDDTDSNTRNAA